VANDVLAACYACLRSGGLAGVVVGKAASLYYWTSRRSLRLWVLESMVGLAGCGAADVSVPAAIAPTSAQATRTRLVPTVPPPTATVYPTLVPTRTVSVPPTAEPTIRPLTIDERRQIFEEIWQTVDQHYLYADFRGVDWKAMREEYEPRVEADQTQEAFYGDMAEMVARLDDHHSRFLPPAAAQAQDASNSGYETTVGIGVVTQPKADGAFIQMVFPDSPAARADLRPRDRIIAVDGRPYAPSDGDFLGLTGSRVRLNVVRPGSKPRDVVLVRQEVQGRIAPYYRRFPGDIGYVWVPTLWVNDMDEQVSGALTELVADGRLHGLIVDVRANGGGWSKVLSGILSHFVRGQVGMFFDKRHVRPLVIAAPAGPDLRGLPLVVLVDHDTASYAEVLAAILQREAHAQVVGQPSSGNTETIYAYTLKDGSRLWLAQEGFRLQNGMDFEGAGVQPDSAVDVDWTRYSEDDDPQLLEALRLLGAGPK
jgi:carboxyl-terminal processing protease